MRRAFNPPLLSGFGAIGAGRRFEGGGGVRPAVARGVFGAGSGFRGGGAQWGGASFLVFGSFLLVLVGLSFWLGDWALGYHSMDFGHFPVIS